MPDRAQQHGRDRQFRRFTRSPLAIGGWIALASLSFFSIYPVLFLLITSLKTPIDFAVNPMGLPTEVTTSWYDGLFRDGRLVPYLLNSVLIVGGSVGLILVFATLAATALALMRFRMRPFSYLFVVAIMFFPASVQVVPMFLTVNTLGLLNNYLGVILVNAAIHLPFATYLIASYLEGLPVGLIEAAECDGATPLQVVRRIVLPLAAPLLVTLGVLEFLWIWNDLLFPLLILQQDSMRTVTVGLALAKGTYPEVPQLAAIAFVSMVPPLAMFAIFHRSVVTGINAGGLK